MLILSRVCAEFHDHTGAAVFSVTPQTRLTFQEAPETIREDPLFDMLLGDGSLEVAGSVIRKRKLEADPMKDADPSGKRSSGRRTQEKTGPEAEKQLTNPSKKDIIKDTNND